jgi:hypothetical protein
MSEETSEQTIFWIARIMIIFITISFLIVMIGKVSTSKIEPSDTQNYILNNKIVLNCLKYGNNFGSIDESKMNNIKDCITSESGLIINLTYNGISKQKVINPDLADKESFCFDEESFYCNKENFFVIVFDSDKEYNGNLTITEIRLR